MTHALTNPAFDALLRKVALESGFVCPAYKPRCLERRIAVRMRAHGVHTYEDYARVLDGDPAEYQRLVQTLTINVTRLYRNPETFEFLAETIVPELWEKVDGPLRVWSAGCATGEEVYSLAVLFAEHAERLGQLGRLGRVSVLGSDVDRPSLAVASRGEFSEVAFPDIPSAIRQRWFGDGPGGRADPLLSSIVNFEERDLLHGPIPPGPHHLVLCRNMLIYFERHAQEDLLRRMHASLAPDGVLVLGKVETIMGELRSLYDPVSTRERIYRRREELPA